MNYKNCLSAIILALTFAPAFIHCMVTPETSFHSQLASALAFDNRAAMKRLLTKADAQQMKDQNILEALLRVGSADLLQCFLHHGLDVHAPVGESKFTALAYAIIGKDTEPEVITLLQEAGVPVCWPLNTLPGGQAQEDPLYFYTSADATRIFKQLVIHGAPIRHWEGGYHPLISAATQGATETVEFILASGIPVSIANESGVTPLLAAAWKNRCDVASKLLAAGAWINTRDNRNITPLSAAARRGYMAMTKLLLKAGADACIRDSEGKNPMYYASENGHSRIYDLLKKDLMDNPEKYEWVKIPYHHPSGNGNQEVSDCENEPLSTGDMKIDRDDIPPADLEEQESPTDDE